MSIALIFPPTVSSGFGNYYPALPVLAGYLAANGQVVSQIDLNEELAVYLLDHERLARCGAGDFYSGEDGQRDAHDMASVAARLLLRNRRQIFGADGRHRFAERNASPAYLLGVLGHTYVVDRSVGATVAAIAANDPLTDWYCSFFESLGLSSLIPADCTLAGISVAMGPQLFPALVLARQLRQVRPEVRIVLGGPTMSLMQEAAIEQVLKQCVSVDAVVRYEGEVPLLKLAQQAESGRWAPNEVPGTSSVQADVVKHRFPAPGIALDELPFAVYQTDLIAKLEDPELGVVQTRGCYWGRCAYCDFVELYDGSPRFRGRSPKSFVDEIEHLVAQHGVRRFSLITEAIPPSFALKFSKLIQDRGIEIAWSSFAMVDRHFKPKHFEEMVRSGCDHLVIGLETMADRVLDHVHKYANGDDNSYFLQAASEAGISLLVNLIPDLPSTTYGEALDTLKRLDALEHCLAGVSIFPFEATRSSQIGRTPERYGVTAVADTGFSGQAVFADNHLQIVDTGMTPEERVEVVGRFTQFADRVNARKSIWEVQLGAASAGTASLSVARDDVDIVEHGSIVQFFNWRSRQRWEAPAALLKIVERAEAIGPVFSPNEILADGARPAEIGYLVNALIEKGVFVATEGPAK